MHIKIYTLPVLLFLFHSLISSCDKSELDFKKSHSINEDSTNNSNGIIILSNKRPAIFRHYPSFYSSPELYNSFGFYYNALTNNLDYFTYGISIVNIVPYHDSILLMQVGDTTKLILVNNLVICSMKGLDTITKYTYNNENYLTTVESVISTEKYYYTQGNLTKIESIAKPPFSEYSGFSTLNYYDSILLPTPSNFLEINHIDFFTSGSNKYYGLNLFGVSNKNLLKSATSYSGNSLKYDSTKYLYKWSIENKLVKELNIEQNDTIFQKVIYDSYY